MKQFDLSLWLQDKSRKVVTRDGRPARILCTDAKAKDGACIIAAIETDEEEEGYQFFPDGSAFSSKSNIKDCADLFFLDESEEELTEFEKELKCAIVGYHQAVEREEITSYSQDDDFVREFSNRLLELARKQLQPEFDKELDDAYKSRDNVVYNEGVDKGREETIRQYPRWRLAESEQQFDKHILLLEDDRVCFTDYVEEGELYLELNDLLNLPKEEE